MSKASPLIFLFLAALLSACGPIRVDQSLSRAYIAIEGARGAEASRFAIYEYKSALLYLQKAREEEGHSNFEGAKQLAVKAREFADKARVRALQKRRARPRSVAEQRRGARQRAPAARPARPTRPSTPPAPAPASPRRY